MNDTDALVGNAADQSDESASSSSVSSSSGDVNADDEADVVEQEDWSYSRCFSLYLLTVAGGLGGFLFGYDTGVVSGAMVLIRRQFHLSDTWHEVIVAAPLLTAGLSAPVAGLVADYVGRRRVTMFSSVLFAVASAQMALSSSKQLLLLARLVVGVAVGMASSTVPTYISECAPASLRGRLVTANCLLITTGQLTASLVCASLASATNGWRWTLAAAALPALVQLALLLVLPESPRYLVARGRVQEASTALSSLRPSSYPCQRELLLLRRSLYQQQQQQGDDSSVYVRLLRDGVVRKALVVGCSLQIIQQLAAINTVMYYSASIIKNTGISGGNRGAIWWSSVTALFNMLGTAVGMLLVDKLGRRALTLSSLAGVVLSLSLLAATVYTAQQNTLSCTRPPLITCRQCVSVSRRGFCYQQAPLNASCLLARDQCTSSFSWVSSDDEDGNTVCPSQWAWLSVIALCFYLVSFSPGMGPMPWTINSELYPQWARASAVGVATSCNWTANLAVSVSFLSACNWLGQPTTFLLYAGLSLLGWLWLYARLPETRAVSLESTSMLFSPPGGAAHQH